MVGLCGASSSGQIVEVYVQRRELRHTLEGVLSPKDRTTVLFATASLNEERVIVWHRGLEPSNIFHLLETDDTWGVLGAHTQPLQHQLSTEAPVKILPRTIRVLFICAIGFGENVPRSDRKGGRIGCCAGWVASLRVATPCL